MQIKTIEAIKGQETKILHHFGLPEPTGNRHIDCPLCERRKKFRIHTHNGQLKYICVCGSGSILDLVIQSKGYDFKSACKEIDEVIGNTFKPVALKTKPKIQKKEQVMNRFQSLHLVKGTPVEEYLKSRGIYELPEMSVKFSYSEYDHTEKRNFNCMYAVATNDSMEIGYAHKTYLENGKKANIERSKKLETMNKLNLPCPTCKTEHAASVAIRMFPHDEVLGISEGIESALSAKQLFNVPTWSVLNTSIMKAFRAPQGVKHLIIYADNDKNGAGMAAAYHCANRNVLSSNDVAKVTIEVPTKTDFDYNDMLRVPCEINRFTVFK